MNKKIHAIFTILLLTIFPAVSSLSVLSTNSNIFYNNSDSHLIKGVPHVSQETAFYCLLASPTMVFKYYGVNTTLREVVYNSGAGYSLVYPFPESNKVPTPGSHLTFSYGDRSFLASLYGLSYENFRSNNTLTDDECWQEYWEKVKQNISEDIPVIANVESNNFVYYAFNKNESVIPNWLLNIIPSTGGHVIVLVGFNESNETVCYLDPASTLYEKTSEGHYNWMNINYFKTAVSKYPLPYSYGIFTNTSNDPLPREEMFEKAHKRNMEKLKGNISVYDLSDFEKFFENIWNKTKIGINASKELKKDYEKGVKNPFKTILNYKFCKYAGIRRLIIDFLAQLLFSYLNIPQALFEFIQQNNFLNVIVTDKLYTSEYLNENIDIGISIESEAILFEQEAENWSKLLTYNSEIKKRGFFISFPRALLIINKMERIMENIIAIEENIIAESFLHQL